MSDGSDPGDWRILAGNTTHVFHVHRELISRDSADARAKLANGATRMELDLVVLEAVQAYFTYLYNQADDLRYIVFEDGDSSPDIIDKLLKAWVFGTTMRSPKYQNVVMDTLLRLPARRVKEDMDNLVSIAVWALSGTGDKSMIKMQLTVRRGALFKWLLEVLALGLVEGCWSMYRLHTCSISHGLTLALLEKTVAYSRDGGLRKMPTIEDYEKYHEPVEDE